MTMPVPPVEKCTLELEQLQGWGSEPHTAENRHVTFAS